MLYKRTIAKVLEKGPHKVFVVVASFIPHPWYDSVSAEDWFGGEKQNAVDGRCLHKRSYQVLVQPVWADLWSWWELLTVTVAGPYSHPAAKNVDFGMD